MGKIDLHTHSAYSDGTDTVYELVEKAKSCNISYLAVTDHNSIESASEVDYYRSSTFEILRGAEYTAAISRGKLHLLAYQFNPRNQELIQMTDRIQNLCLTRTYDTLEFLKKEHQVIFPETELYRLVGKRGDIGMKYITGLCIQYGYAKSEEEAKEKYFQTIYDKMRFGNYRLPPEEIIEIVHKAGGVVSLAHHNTVSKDYEKLKNIVEYLSWYGLDAIESKHSTFYKKDRVYAEKLAKEFHLLKSVGTDYHGENKTHISLGSGASNNMITTNCSMLDELIQRGKVKKIEKNI